MILRPFWLGGQLLLSSIFCVAVEAWTENWTEANASNLPSGRNAHSAAVGSDGVMWIYGGWDGSTVGDLWSIDLEATSLVWTEASVSSAGNYFGHSTVLLNGVLWLYGGLGDGDYSGYSNRLYSIDLQASPLAWTYHGQKWFPRYFHTAVVTADGLMWVWGGLHYSVGRLQHFTSFDLQASSLSRKTLSSSNEPTARSEHSAVVTEAGVMWLFGGDDGSKSDELFSIDLHADSLVWTDFSSSSPRPGARSSHTAVVTTAGVMWIYGGINSANDVYHDVWSIDVEAASPIWTLVSVSGPVGRWRHTGVITTGGTLWVFGGHDMTSNGANGLRDDLWSIQVDQGSWKQMIGMLHVKSWPEELPILFYERLQKAE